ncbi:hypothetical protein MTO96_015257 [Rhipicephalus appendiculatus]
MDPVTEPVTPLKSGLAAPLVPDAASYAPLIPPPPEQALPIAGVEPYDAPVAAWARSVSYPMPEVPVPSQPQPMPPQYLPPQYLPPQYLPPPPPPPPLMFENPPEQAPISKVTGAGTTSNTFWGGKFLFLSRSVTLLFLKVLCVGLLIFLILTGIMAILVHDQEPERKDRDDTNVAVTEPTMKIDTPRTTTTLKPMICTVGETLRVGDAITEGICDYAIFSELAVVGGDLKPVRGPHAWDVFKKAIARTNKTKGGVSFTSFKATEPEGTMHQLGNMSDKLLELVSDYKVLSFGMLGFNHDYSLNDDVFGRTFEHLKSALEPRNGSMTFLGVWLVTSTNAEAFTRIRGSTQFIDIVIIQTHITLTAKYRACYAYMISQRKEAGDVPNLETAEVALRNFQELRIDGLRVMFSSTMAVMVYVSGKNTPTIGPRRRNCDHFFMADIDSICQETLGSLQSEYWPEDMSESITYRDGNGGYMFVLRECQFPQ